MLLTVTGRHAEAISEISKARSLDPLNLTFNLHVGWHLYFARQFNEARQQLQATLDLDPSWWDSYYHLGQTYEQTGMLEDAITALDKAVSLSANPIALAGLGHAYGLAGRQSDGLKIAKQLEADAERGYVPPYQIAAVYAGLGKVDQAFEWLESAFEERDYWLPFLAVDPMLDPLRSDPRFQDILRRLNLAG